MKPTKLLFYLSLVVVFPSMFAFSNADSLKQQFARQKGLTKIETGLQLFDSLAEPEQQMTFAKSLLLLIKEEAPNSMQLARIHRKLSDCYLSFDSVEQSIRHLLSATEIAQQQSAFDTVFVADAYNELGLNYNELGSNSVAKKYLVNSILLFEKTGKIEDIANVKNDLAVVFHDQGNYS